jgi:hypothetical protein
VARVLLSRNRVVPVGRRSRWRERRRRSRGSLSATGARTEEEHEDSAGTGRADGSGGEVPPTEVARTEAVRRLRTGATADLRARAATREHAATLQCIAGG